MFNHHFGIGIGYDRFATHFDVNKGSFNGRLNVGHQGRLIYVKGGLVGQLRHSQNRYWNATINNEGAVAREPGQATRSAQFAPFDNENKSQVGPPLPL